MANPNIVGVTAIYGKTTYTALTTSLVTQLTNSASSGEIVKINCIRATNNHGTNDGSVTIALDGSSGTPIGTSNLASTLPIPADSTVIILGKDAPIYLEEGWFIQASGLGTSMDMDCIISYEVIS
jgi:hypothetical protein